MKLIYTILLSTCLVLTAQAQTKISGSVKDDKGEVVPGANILIKDSYDGTSSGIEGKFSFVSEESGSQILEATFLL